MKKESDKYFPIFWKEMLFTFICAACGCAAVESDLKATSMLLFIAAGVMFIVAFFTLIVFCGDNN